VVVEIRGDKVRLGVEAPKEVPVHRREVFDAIHRAENEAAAESQHSGQEAEVERDGNANG
jgi:carbon storage regulator